MTENIFIRNVPGTTEILRDTVVGIAGCGGLGSNAAVALVRAGVGKLILADFDVVEASNLNRQYFFQTDIGRVKVEALADRLRQINPDVALEAHNIRLAPPMIAGLFKEADLMLEAFDKAESKHWLIDAWCEAFPQRPIVIGSGISGTGSTRALAIREAANLHFIGDGVTDMNLGLCAPRVAVAANMQANVAVSLLLGLKDV